MLIHQVPRLETPSAAFHTREREPPVVVPVETSLGYDIGQTMISYVVSPHHGTKVGVSKGYAYPGAASSYKAHLQCKEVPVSCLPHPHGAKQPSPNPDPIRDALVGQAVPKRISDGNAVRLLWDYEGLSSWKATRIWALMESKVVFGARWGVDGEIRGTRMIWCRTTCPPTCGCCRDVTPLLAQNPLEIGMVCCALTVERQRSASYYIDIPVIN